MIQFSTSGYNHKRIESKYRTDILTSIVTAVSFTIAKRWKQSKSLLMDEWINKCGIYIQWNINQPLNGRKF